MPRSGHDAAPGDGVTVRYFGTTRRLFGPDDAALDHPAGGDVLAVLEAVCDTAARRQAVFSGPGELRGDVAVLVNGRNVRLMGGLGTRIERGDVIAIVPPMAGG